MANFKYSALASILLCSFAYADSEANSANGGGQKIILISVK